MVLAVGTELGETDYDTVFDGRWRIDAALVRVDIDAAQLFANCAPACTVLGDARDALARLCAALPQAAPGVAADAARWGISRVRAVRAQIESGLTVAAKAQRHYLQVVLDELPDALFLGDSTQPVYQGNLLIDMPGPGRWFNSSTGYGTLGYGLPAALGARLQAQGRPVVCLIGDGGLQFTLPELASAVQERLPVIVLLWNNCGYGEIRRCMQERAIEAIGVDIDAPDFQMLARGFGCDSSRADDAAALRQALRQAGRAARSVPHLIETAQASWFANFQADAAHGAR